MTVCPKCGYKPISAESHFCPNCGQSLEVVRQVGVDQQVGTNYGNVIGVQTQAIHGDVYGGDIYQVQVYVLGKESRANADQFLEANAPPYNFLAPYGPREAAIFKGRQAEIDQTLRLIGAGRLLVLFGAAGVGKTSLLAAGVIPNLLRNGALAVHIRDYTQPLSKTLHSALASTRDNLPLQLPENSSLADLIASVQTATGGTMVLVLDQFERLFLPGIPADLQAQQVGALVAALRAVEPQYLRLIISVRDQALVRLSDLQEALPEVFRSFLELKPFSLPEARSAILDPLQVVQRKVFFEDKLVDELLLPDLDDLTPDKPGEIHPPHLQIVCHGLYETFVDREHPYITRKDYLDELHGADGILASYLEKTLNTSLADQRQLAERILVAMADPHSSTWVSAPMLALDAVDPQITGQVLDRLARARLLEQGQLDNQPVYALTSQAVVDDVYRLAGPQIEQRERAQRDLERIWSGWLAAEDLATAHQLRRLSAAAADLAPSPLQSLVLLRSAVTAGLSTTPWLATLRTAQGRRLLAEVENLPRGKNGEQTAEEPSQTEFSRARRLLGLAPQGKGSTASPQNPPTRPSNPDSTGGTAQNANDQPFGPVTWAAVTNPDGHQRQTSVLALLAAAGPHQTLDRLKWAFQQASANFPGLRRRAEIYGALAEADGEIEKLNSDLTLWERLAVLAWRSVHRITRDGPRLAFLALGAGFGGGACLALLRFITALLTGRTPGLNAMIYFIYGAFLGTSLILGFILAGYLPVSPETGKGPRPASPWLAILLSGLLFGIAHLLTAFTSGSLALQGKEWVALTGLLAGILLGISLSPWKPLGTSQEKQAVSPPGWFMFSGALIFSLMQGIFLLRNDLFRSMVILLPAAAYRADFNPNPAVYLAMALIDAALAGGLLAGGILLGLRAGRRLYSNWLLLQEAQP
jgi:Novel STAND NTPase 1